MTKGQYDRVVNETGRSATDGRIGQRGRDPTRTAPHGGRDPGRSADSGRSQKGSKGGKGESSSGDGMVDSNGMWVTGTVNGIEYGGK